MRPLSCPSSPSQALGWAPPKQELLKLGASIQPQDVQEKEDKTSRTLSMRRTTQEKWDLIHGRNSP